MSEPRLITKESVIEWLSGDLGKHVVPHPIEGIPEGFSFFRNVPKEIGDLVQRGYLMAFTPGYPFNRYGAHAVMPVIVKKTDSPQVVDMEFETQGKALAELFKVNLANIDNPAYAKN